eukprot:6371417-Prymnesium_polylepis.1
MRCGVAWARRGAGAVRCGAVQVRAVRRGAARRAHLALGHADGVAVAIHRDGQPELAFGVALREELGHDASDPRLEDGQRPRGVGDVGRLDDH